MIAHYNGQTWKSTEVAGSLGIAPNTARRYMDTNEQTFMIRQLQPWFVNVKKRLVKSPKLYFRDPPHRKITSPVNQAHPSNSFLKTASTICGFAFPPVAFMTRPFRALIALALPSRYSATGFGFSAITVAQIPSISPVSLD